MILAFVRHWDFNTSGAQSDPCERIANIRRVEFRPHFELPYHFLGFVPRAIS